MFRPERPGLVAGAAGQPVAEMNGCPRAPVPWDTARGTEPGLQAPWHFQALEDAAATRGELAGGE